MRLVRRQWGWYLTLVRRKRFRVKLLRFTAHQECSYQYHLHRNELWLFLKGKGALLLGKEYNDAKPGEWYLIDEAMKHQYRAHKTTYVLEIQFGTDCREDDIVRIQHNI